MAPVLSPHFPPLSKESTLDPTADTFSMHRTTTLSCSHSFAFYTTSQGLQVPQHKLFKASLAHATCGFGCLPFLLGITVNSSITRGLGQPTFVTGCIVGKPKHGTILNASRLCPWERSLCRLLSGLQSIFERHVDALSKMTNLRSATIFPFLLLTFWHHRSGSVYCQ